MVSPQDPAGVAQAVQNVSTNPKFRAAAGRFATTYRTFDPAASARRLGDHVEESIARRLR